MFNGNLITVGMAVCLFAVFVAATILTSCDTDNEKPAPPAAAKPVRHNITVGNMAELRSKISDATTKANANNKIDSVYLSINGNLGIEDTIGHVEYLP